MTPRQRARRQVESYRWDKQADDFASYYGLDREIVEAVARYPQGERRDPYSEKVGHTIMNYRRGDIIVTVGFRDPENPMILHVRLITGEEKTARGAGGSGGAGKDAGAVSTRALKRKAVELGYKIVAGTNHDKVVDPDNGNHLILVIPRNSGTGDGRQGRRGQNAYSTLIGYHKIRKHIKEIREEESEKE